MYKSSKKIKFIFCLRKMGLNHYTYDSELNEDFNLKKEMSKFNRINPNL